MNTNEKEQNLNPNFRIGEIIFGLGILIYFLCYPRDTISDFVVLSISCLLLIIFETKIGLSKPDVLPFSKVDIFFAIFSLSLFLAAWIHGFMVGKLNFNSGLESLCITIVYFYYAWIQHFLAQRYLALRMLGVSKKLKSHSPIDFHTKITAALMTGFIFGIIHIPYPHLMFPSALGGFLFSYYFLKTGRLWAVVCSHALISSAGLFWFLDDNPFWELVELL